MKIKLNLTAILVLMRNTFLYITHTLSAVHSCMPRCVLSNVIHYIKCYPEMSANERTVGVDDSMGSERVLIVVLCVM